jgi:hypothetical protein
MAMALVQAQPSPAPANRDIPSAGEVVFVAGTVMRRTTNDQPQALAKGDSVGEGDRFEAGNDGYAYIRLRDGGLLVLRPQAQLRIERWRYDPRQPERSEIKYTLDSGVARHVSGRAAQAARDHFRFNTPVAAIGVRGTDFTVLAEPGVTRVSVRSGGVVVSSFGSGCAAEGSGPCGGDTATELFASAREKLLQLRAGERRPELVDIGLVPAPERVRPPAANEPVAGRTLTGEVMVAESRGTDVVASGRRPPEPVVATAPAEVITPVAVVAPPAVPAPVPVVAVSTPSVEVVPDVPLAAWGRWSGMSDKDAEAVATQVTAGRRLLAINNHFLLAVDPKAMASALPETGVGDFRLTAHQGLVIDGNTGRTLASTASDGKLRIDFAERRFETSLQLKAAEISGQIQSKGSVGTDGSFMSDLFVSPTIVTGVVGGKKAGEAAYLYQGPIGDRIEASGATSWKK